MAQFASLVVLPTRTHSNEENVLQVTAALLAESLEDLGLAERVERALRATGYSVLRDIEVLVEDGAVHLIGQVPTYHVKQIAQETALATPGALRVLNDLDVIPMK